MNNKVTNNEIKIIITYYNHYSIIVEACTIVGKLSTSKYFLSTNDIDSVLMFVHYEADQMHSFNILNNYFTTKIALVILGFKF